MCACERVCVRVYMFASVYVCVYVCACLCVYMGVNVCVWMYMCMHVRARMCLPASLVRTRARVKVLTGVHLQTPYIGRNAVVSTREVHLWRRILQTVGTDRME